MRAERFERLSLWLAVGLAVGFLFLPLLLIDGFHEEADAVGGRAGEVAVGIAVIVRATARRVLSTTVSSILRTTFATFSRTAARTALRRLLRFVLRTLFGVLIRDMHRRQGGEAPPPSAAVVEGGDQRRPWLPLLVGCGALALSFLGVLAVNGPQAMGTITSGAALGLPAASLVAALPLLVYGLVHMGAARALEVDLRVNTAVDGLLLQAYFTGAGSFLPMTTDLEYQGEGRDRMRLALLALATLYGCHLGLAALHAWSGMAVFGFASSMFLLYCFVYSFPIKPLEGHDIWEHSRVLWICAFVPILASFFFGIPEYFSAIL